MIEFRTGTHNPLTLYVASEPYGPHRGRDLPGWMKDGEWSIGWLPHEGLAALAVEAWNAFVCQACPWGCPSCSLNRATCECYEHQDRIDEDGRPVEGSTPIASPPTTVLRAQLAAWLSKDQGSYDPDELAEAAEMLLDHLDAAPAGEVVSVPPPAEAACCVDAEQGPDAHGTLLHTLGCPNRCGVDTTWYPPRAPLWGSPYPCGTTVGHEGDHWAPPSLRTPLVDGRQAHPESYCHCCGGPNVVWSAPSPLWNAVMRGGSINGDDEHDGIVCPTCFGQIAEKRGIASLWRLDAEVVTAEVETVTPSGRVWDGAAWRWREPLDDPSPVPPPVDALLDLVDDLHSAVRDDDSTGIDRARGNIVMAVRDLYAAGVEEGHGLLDRAVIQEIEQRERAEEIADKLTAAIGRHLGDDFGEHSNLNDPWGRALVALAEADAGGKFAGGAYEQGIYDAGVAEGRRQATEERTEEQHDAVTVKRCLGADRGHGLNDVHYWRCPTPECAGHLCRKGGWDHG